MRAGRGPLGQHAVRVVLLGLLFAAATEAGQGLLPTGRTARLADALADAAGLLLGVGAFCAEARFLPKKPAPRPPEGADGQ